VGCTNADHISVNVSEVLLSVNLKIS